MSFARVNLAEKSVDMREVNQALGLLRGHQFLSMCRDALRKRLFSEGIVFLKGFKAKKVQIPDLQKNELVEDYWLPFARNALDCLLAFGVVPYRMLSVDGHNVPIVPASGSYKLFYRIEESGLLSFSGKMLNGIDGDSISVLSGFGYDPFEGTLSSVVASCVPTMAFIRSLHQDLVTSEALKNFPVIYTESQQKEIKEGEGVSFDYYADAQDMKKLPTTTFNRSAKDIQQLEAQKAAYSDTVTSLRHGDAEGAQHAAQHAEGALERLVPLPPGMKLVKMTSSSSRSDFVAILKQKQNELAASFGLPISMVLADTSNAKSDQTSAHETFRSTVLFWQNLLGRVLTTVHSTMSNGDHSEALKKLQKRKDGANKEALYKLKEKEAILIHFPVKTFGTSDETLQELYDQEIIDRKTYCEFRLKNAGLPLDLLFRKDDPLSSADHKRQYVEPEPVQPAAAAAAAAPAPKSYKDRERPDAAPKKKKAEKNAEKPDLEKKKKQEVQKKKKAQKKETSVEKKETSVEKKKRLAAAKKRKATADAKKPVKRKKQ